MATPLRLVFKTWKSCFLALMICVASTLVGFVAPVHALDAATLHAGSQALIREPSGNPVTVYSAPDVKAPKITELASSVAVRLTAGPTTNQTNIWWRIRGQRLEGYILSSTDGGKTQNLVLTSGKALAQDIADATQLIAQQSNNTAAFIRRGIIYVSIAEADKAIADFKQAVSLKPDTASAFYYLGFAYAVRNSYP